ncbi:MAG: ROK family protein [Actinobacteria bacterium]|nr:ROK family protein [Actinomycetota bacterium]
MARSADTAGGSRGTLGRALTQLHLAGGQASRAELTRTLDCGRSVMGYLLGELEDEGLVAVEPGTRAPGEGGGRPSQQVEVAPGAPVVIAADLAADAITVATVALGGRVVRRERRALPARISVEAGVTRLAEQIAAQLDGERVGAVTVAVPSPVRRADGEALAPLHLHWPQVPLRDLLLERFAADERTAGLAVHVANDANLSALAESRRGAGRGASTMLYLGTATVGIGGGLAVDGTLFEGSRGYAIEPGHVTVNPAGRPCTCGSTGCLEVEADTRALLRAYGRDDVPAEELTARADALLDAAAAGDAAARAAVEEANLPLGVGLAGLINLTDPDCVVLGSSLGRRFELAPDPVRRGIAARSYIDAHGEVPVRPGALADATLVGAAELAFQPLLDDPHAWPHP